MKILLRKINASMKLNSNCRKKQNLKCQKRVEFQSYQISNIEHIKIMTLIQTFK